ncbi:Ppx/GppA family phosphatase [Mesorhizobium sp. M9A.F.Ca.ET.002.03.1.2]|uniref:Ppx/GppA phosphatase family protein n=1 Tax=Mesorhizobium sp. M9A.F.Ca.ET.002.03.1.2 TaxID=2493668 RepID=UPI000F7634DB|nr:Ppx/GppA phosphatase family protein [Mesorhizobium sp. M9A.F.Ca.ET.002.03.1.2]AZN99292.1 Ppx/GppA family phosphatase [Mesorhizobium sp. M9A.F.Ca.ET.002.03.1.2]
MEDHDTGAGAPEVGVSTASPPPSGPASPSAGRQNGRPVQPWSGQAGDASRDQNGQHQNGQHQNGQNQKAKTRKRRKRRRGRKVFARDDAQFAAAGLSAPAVTSAPAGRPPEAIVAPLPSVSQARPEQAVRRPPVQELPVFAALDLGTNNCRLLVAIPTRHGQFRVIDAFSRIVRLGEGLTANGRLGQPAMDRAVEALKICGDKLRSRKIRKARLIATEACRTAANGAEFLDRVEREAGLKLEIIDRQTEARLAVSGCGSLVERDTQGVVLFDIGGGSSEIALIDLTGHRSPRLANHIVSWTSLPVGVVSLAERFGGRTVTREVFAAMVEDVAVRLHAFDGRDRLSHVLASPKFHLLGTSGTVTTLAGVHLDLERYDRRRVDGLWMDRDSVDRMVERLVGWDFQQRVANPCIGADRADLVLAGCAILEAIRAMWPSERLRVADRGLREGILSELMADDGVWRNSGRARA